MSPRAVQGVWSPISKGEVEASLPVGSHLCPLKVGGAVWMRWDRTRLRVSAGSAIPTANEEVRQWSSAHAEKAVRRLQRKEQRHSPAQRTDLALTCLGAVIRPKWKGRHRRPYQVLMILGATGFSMSRETTSDQPDVFGSLSLLGSSKVPANSRNAAMARCTATSTSTPSST